MIFNLGIPENVRIRDLLFDCNNLDIARGWNRGGGSVFSQLDESLPLMYVLVYTWCSLSDFENGIFQDPVGTRP